MSERAHLYLPLTDSSNVVYPFARISLLDPATGDPIPDVLYADGVSQQTLTQPFLCQPAVVDVWVDTPQRVTLVAALPGEATWTMAGVDLLPSPDTVVTTGTPLAITNPASVSAPAALVAAEDEVSAAWQVIGLFQVHQHAGDSANSTVVGEQPRDWSDDQTWMGVGAGGGSDQGSDTTALGASAIVHASQSVAIGAASAAAAQSVAVGGSATAMGTGSIALGSSAGAPGTSQSILGTAASASATGATVASATAAAGTAIELGGLLQLGTAGGGLLGPGPSPSTSALIGAPFTVINSSAVIPAGLARVTGSAVLGSAVATSVATHGSTGAAPMVLDTSTLATSTPGYSAIISLVAALTSLGLVYNATGAQLNDTFVNLAKTSSYTSGISLDTSNPPYFDNRASRVTRSVATPQSLTYAVTSPKDFAVLMYIWPQTMSAAAAVAQLAVTAGATSIPLLAHTPVPTSSTSGWSRCWISPTAPLPAGTTSLTFTLQGTTESWEPELGQVIIR